MKTISRRTALASLVTATAGGMLLSRNLKAEDQPRMRAALEHLEKAKAELQAATNDKGGHRGKALNAVNQAITHVREGIKFDNRH